MRKWWVLLALSFACGNEVTTDSVWDLRSAMDVPRSEMPAVVVEGQIWVPGGLTQNLIGYAGSDVVEIYDPVADTWQRGPDLPEPSHHSMAVAVGSDVYVIGGFGGDDFGPTATVWRTQGGAWEELQPLPEVRAAGAAVAFNDSIYVIGGVPSGSSVLRYDIATGAWAEEASLLEAREHTAAAVHDGLIYVAGGRWNNEMLTSVEVYDPATGQWSAGPSLIEARSGFALVSLTDHLVALGGEVFSPSVATLTSIEVLRGESWELTRELPEALHGVPAVGLDDTLLVLGGSRRAGDVDNAGAVWATTADDLD